MEMKWVWKELEFKPRSNCRYHFLATDASTEAQPESQPEAEPEPQPDAQPETQPEVSVTSTEISLLDVHGPVEDPREEVEEVELASLGVVSGWFWLYGQLLYRGVCSKHPATLCQIRLPTNHPEEPAPWAGVFLAKTLLAHLQAKNR